MTTTARPELKPVKYPNGQTRYADDGAVAQGGLCALKQCSACGGYVVFVKSTKTGKWYLADCFPYAGGNGFYYVKSSPHFKSCEKRVAENQKMMNERHFQAETKTFMDSFNFKQPNWEEAFESGMSAIAQKYGQEWS